MTRVDQGSEKATSEETTVVDSRAAMTPAQAVEMKLVTLMGDRQVPVSRLQFRRTARGAS